MRLRKTKKCLAKPAGNPPFVGNEIPSQTKESQTNTDSSKNLRQCDFKPSDVTDACDAIQRQPSHDSVIYRSPYLKSKFLTIFKGNNYE